MLTNIYVRHKLRIGCGTGRERRSAGMIVNRIVSSQLQCARKAHLNSALMCLRTLCLIFSALMGNLACAQQATSSIRLATLEWPPYTGRDLPDGGHSTVIVREAFGAAGRSLHTTFYPWSRAISKIKDRTEFIGYYPEYASIRTRKECFLSDPIGSSRLGFAQLPNKPLTWKSVVDLSKYRIGVVDNYVNSESLDAAIAEGRQIVDVARDDTQNLRKLLAGRVDAAVIDEAVLDYLMRTNVHLRPHRDKVAFADRALETQGIYVCFQRSAEGRQARELFNTGLKITGTRRIDR